MFFNWKRIFGQGTQPYIVRDSILNGIQENRIGKNHSVKVRPFPGSDIDDMYCYITPLLRKKPTNIFLHIGANDAPNKNSDVILKELLRLKLHIETELPSANLFLSTPVMRTDDANARLTIKHMSNNMKSLKCNSA